MPDGGAATISNCHVIERAHPWEREPPPSLGGFHVRCDPESGPGDRRQLARPLPVCETRVAAPRSAGRRGHHQRLVAGALQASPTGIADYAVAKGGLVTLTYYLASEYGADDARANCIAPGPVPTDLNRPFLGTPEGRAMTASFIPLGRVGQIDDVARAALFLASDEARWITGAVLRVDGGIVVQ